MRPTFWTTIDTKSYLEGWSAHSCGRQFARHGERLFARRKEDDSPCTGWVISQLLLDPQPSMTYQNVSTSNGIWHAHIDISPLHVGEMIHPVCCLHPGKLSLQHDWWTVFRANRHEILRGIHSVPDGVRWLRPVYTLFLVMTSLF